MAATAEQIAQLRRMTAEQGDGSTYTDAVLLAYIEKYTLMDERGQEPFYFVSALPPVRESNLSWIPTYDLSAAAAEIWAEKAGVLAQDYDTSADGASLSRSQAYRQAMEQSRYFSARRQARSLSVYPSPRPVSGDSVSINGPEVDE